MSDEAKPSTLDEVEGLRKQLETANQRLIQAELKSQAIRAGIVDLDGLKMMDMSEIKLAEDGSVAGGVEAIAKLKREKPWVFGAANSSHPAAPPAPEAPKMRTAKEMTFDEWRLARARLIRGR